MICLVKLYHGFDRQEVHEGISQVAGVAEVDGKVQEIKLAPVVGTSVGRSIGE